MQDPSLRYAFRVVSPEKEYHLQVAGWLAVLAALPETVSIAAASCVGAKAWLVVWRGMLLRLP